jgi:hypothetical protein
MPRVRRALLALSLLLVPLTAGAADAATWTHRDARGDATLVEIDTKNRESTTSAAPEAANVDITRVVVRHRPRRVTLDIGVRDLGANGSTSVLGRLVTPSGSWLLMAARSPGAFTQMLMPTRGRVESTCSAMTSEFDSGPDVVRIEIPRACLGAPAWIRAGLLLSDDSDFALTPHRKLPADPSESMTTTFDDALRSGGTNQFPKLGAKVRVG